MKKVSKRFLSVLLTATIICCIFMVFPVSSNAVVINGTSVGSSAVQEKLNLIKSVYPTGSYFTASGNVCYSNQSWDCQLSNIPSRGGLPSGSTVSRITGEAWSCCSFARYVFYCVFGVSPTSCGTVSAANASIGDYIDFGSHYGIFLGQDSNYWYIYDSNYTDPPTNIVKYNRAISKSRLSAKRIYHASNIEQCKGTQEISDGEYHVVSALDESYGLNVAYDSTDNGANVQLWNNMTDKNTSSLINIKYLGTGYYTFTFINSGKLLDVSYGGKESGTNVWQCNPNSSDAQQWVIKPSGDGYFYIISKCNNLYLDVTNGVVSPSTNIQVCNGNNSKAQKWKFVASGYSTGRTISDGDYHIVSALDKNYGLNVAYDSQETGANVQLWNNMNEDNKSSLVNVKYMGYGYYALTFINSGKSLDVTDGGTIAGTNIQQCNCNNSDTQRWIIKNIGNDCYNIIAKNSGLYLDLTNGKIVKANNIQLYIGNRDNAQKWKFVASGLSTGKTIQNGDYHIVTALDDSFGLNVSYDSTVDGANVQLWDNMDNKNQTSVVNVEYIDNGMYSLVFRNSNKAIDVENSGASSNVLQWSKNGNDCQKWIIKPDGKGNYNIISKCGGRYLNISGGNATLAANINVSVANSLDCQSWKFVLQIEKGDVDRDGELTVKDATEIQKYIVEITELDDEQRKVADVDGDKDITVKDATQIQKYLVELIPSLG